MPRAETLARLGEAKLVPVIRTSTAAAAETVVAWLAEAGFTVFEITLTIPGATGLIADIAGREGMVVGAGTVMTREAAERCLDAGARFIVSPCVADALPPACGQAGVPCILGALTPTEVRAAVEAGADAVKIFPVSSVGGPAYVKALKAVFPEVPLVPTGGITPDEVAAYLGAGAAFVGIGGKLVDQALVAAGRREELVKTARAVLATVAAS
jgi:2-dehydro-3-deoxyphosphogluconate aldolase/(4S)-4-hydroxy-2-oxoglutarate aldolase